MRYKKGSKLDNLIDDLVNDYRYTIKSDGTVTNAKGKRVGYLKKYEQTSRGKAYMYLQYKGHELKLHRVIYRKFKGKLDKTLVVHHIDGNSSNNDISNLDQVTLQENSYFATYPDAYSRGVA